MTIFDENLILETINMIKLYNFDIRTVTLTISLRDCLSENVNTVCDNIKFKLDKYAKNLVNFCEKRKEKINNNAMQEITTYVEKIKARAELESLPYEKLIQKAKNVFQSSDFMEEKQS